MKFVLSSPALMKRGAAFVATASMVAAPLALTGLVGASADAAGSAGLVISEVYGGGGNSSATFTNDYIELYNPTGAAIDVSSMSVQYRSATGTGNPSGVTPLTGSVASHGYYLVQEASGGSTGTALPAPDATGTINLGAAAGTVFLANQPGALTAPPTGSIVGNPAIIDLVGFGTSTTFETAAAPAGSNTTSIARDNDGTDTNDNSADFTAGAGTPGTGTTVTPPPVTEPATIEQIQGSGDTSPLVGHSVQTTGVVTAAYPTGGFNGFYLQTGGTGGAVDLSTHDTSDAVFVFAPSEVDSVHVGDTVEVTGLVSEFFGMTEVSATEVDPAPAVAPVEAATVALPRTTAQRESLEGMLLAPQGDYTVADNYALNQYGEIGLASGDEPLFAPTEVADPHDAAAIAAVNADNAARAVTLDDGSSTNFFSTGKNTALSYLTQDDQIRVGERVTFHQGVILDYRNSGWDFQPTYPVDGTTAVPVTFSHTRTDAPAATGGNLHLASFNVLNYFPTTGADWTSTPGNTCTYYDDRAGNHITVNTCTNASGAEGPRGAADQANFLRQQAKIVHAINHLGADIVSLEEIENAAKFGHDRDWAVNTLVEALNADAGAGTWKFVPTPSTSGDQSSEDVIRTAFIYKPAAVEPIGESEIDNSAPFDVARDPLAQAWNVVGGDDSTKFGVIVNHFKSKGSGPDDGTGQGNSNPQRIAEADDLVNFATQVKSDFGTDKLFLSGDFNAYTKEDPLEHLYAAGYTDIGSHEAPDEHTYLFGGTVGSLDHVLANGPALAMVTGAHVWNINSVEPVALEYSRYNYNLTNFYTDAPFRASDHDPLVVGINDLPPAAGGVSVSATADDVVYGSKAVVHVTVNATPTAKGRVRVLDGSTVLGSGHLDANGQVDVTIPAGALLPGGHRLTVSYDGNKSTQAASTTLVLRVTKATPSLTVKVSPNKIKKGVTAPVVSATLKAPGQDVTGTVQVWQNGAQIGTGTVGANGKVEITLPAYAATGTQTIQVRYLGSETAKAVNASISFTVVN